MYKKYVKRILDIIISLLFLPFWFICFLIIAPLIYISDRGPIFYNAERLGENGKVFLMYKFRSMKNNAPDLRNPDGSTYNAEDDPRVTRIGRILRKTSLDETPQLINVLKGDMSFVGPRPDLPSALSKYSNTEIKKTHVKPGVTGYSQAYYRNSIDMKRKYMNDIYYVNNISFLMDLKIILKTFFNVIKRENIFNK